MKFRSWPPCLTMIAALAVLAGLAVSPATATPSGVDAALFLYDGVPGSDRLEAAADAAFAAGVAPGHLQELVTAAHESGLEAGVLAGWLDRTASVAVRRLPTAPVVSRYLQGLSKGVPPGRIDVAVDELVTRLDAAALRLDAVCGAQAPETPGTRLRAIDHVAYALGLGVSPEQLDHSIGLAWKAHGDLESVEPPVLTLGILVSSGITPEKSMEVLDVAWVNGYQGPELERLGKSLGRLGHHGNPPSVEVVNEVIDLIGKEASQERVFRGLDELVGREEYRLSGSYPGGDPTRSRIAPTKPEGPSETPGKDDQQLRYSERDG